MSLANTMKGFIFKKPAQAQVGEENPYLNARRSWNDMMKSVIALGQGGILFGITGALIALAAVGGIIHIGSQSKFVPYIVEVDKLGQAQAYGQATRGSAADQRVVASRVASFIADSRVVTPDVKLQRDAVFRTYAVLAPNDPATQKMNEWLNGSADSSPFARAAKETVSVEIKSVMPQTPETWQVDWVETVRDRQGVKKGEATHRALVTVYQAEATPNTKEEEIWMNPIRLFVRDFSWSKQF
ncbi:conjugal transfer protein TrbF [Pseudomonas aeruginosa]|uniref:conjugal transfer protein TrbF n=1 Tax=Pseudomonas aeruginosa TaxID=287 RepID=UPI0021F10011|nr:conjugal transfer protein TrbF [Pseudomonas aeruginosa]MCV4039520.1 conjugal transfer protein TrbF [Pseudomonas aeruginosa]